MSLKKDKQKVLGEVFDDERVKSFLNYEAPAGVSTDFHLLEKAYRGMNVGNFATFLAFFTQAGHDLNATNPEGHTLAQIASQHGHGADYVSALKTAGAL
ncbi:MAG: PA4642 family protein [Porticoccaceae bacterium]|nr:PA4642 family protein [Porticoccaceae bacterium]